MTKFILLLLLLLAFVKADFVDEDVDESQEEELDLSSEELDLSSPEEQNLSGWNPWSTSRRWYNRRRRKQASATSTATCQGNQHSFLEGRLKIAYAMCDNVPNAVVEWDPKLGWSCELFNKKTFALPCSGTVCSHTFSWGMSLDVCDVLVTVLTMGAGKVMATAVQKAFAVAARSSQAVIRRASQGMKDIAAKQAQRKASKAAKDAAGGLCGSAAAGITMILNCLSRGLGDKFSKFAVPLIEILHKMTGSISLNYKLHATWDVSKRNDRNSGGIGYGLSMTNEFVLNVNIPTLQLPTKAILTAIGANNNIGHGCRTTDWTRPKLAESVSIKIFPERSDPWDVRINCNDASILGISAEDVEKAYKAASREISKFGDAVGDWGKNAGQNIGNGLRDAADAAKREADRLARAAADALKRQADAAARALWGGKRRRWRRNLDEEEMSSEDELSAIEDLLNVVLSEQN